MNMLEDFGIEHKVSSVVRMKTNTHFIKILSITADNATNNDAMVDAMGEDARLPEFTGRVARVRCFLHILNLVVKSLLREFDAGGGKLKDGEEEGVGVGEE